MSINWVMLTPDRKSYVPLGGEQQYFKSPLRTSLSIKTANKNISSHEAFGLSSSDGTCFLTNFRIVYIPSKPTNSFESFAAPILNCLDAFVNAPYFGPNYWTALVTPVPGGNLPAHVQAIEIKLTFKDGGAFDYHTYFERIKERSNQVVNSAIESSQIQGRHGRTRSSEIRNLNLVHLDDLPAYTPPSAPVDYPVSPSAQISTLSVTHASDEIIPPEEPPGYEEVQRNTIANTLEMRLRSGEDERQRQEEEDEEDDDQEDQVEGHQTEPAQ